VRCYGGVPAGLGHHIFGRDKQGILDGLRAKERWRGDAREFLHGSRLPRGSPRRDELLSKMVGLIPQGGRRLAAGRLATDKTYNSAFPDGRRPYRGYDSLRCLHRISSTRDSLRGIASGGEAEWRGSGSDGDLTAQIPIRATGTELEPSAEHIAGFQGRLTPRGAADESAQEDGGYKRSQRGQGFDEITSKKFEGMIGELVFVSILGSRPNSQRSETRLNDHSRK